MCKHKHNITLIQQTVKLIKREKKKRTIPWLKTNKPKP